MRGVGNQWQAGRFVASAIISENKYCVVRHYSSKCSCETELDVLRENVRVPKVGHKRPTTQDLVKRREKNTQSSRFGDRGRFFCTDCRTVSMMVVRVCLYSSIARTGQVHAQGVTP